MGGDAFPLTNWYDTRCFSSAILTLPPPSCCCRLHREVLAAPDLLNAPERVDWKACSVPKEEEAALTKTFREGFKPFDCSLD